MKGHIKLEVTPVADGHQIGIDININDGSMADRIVLAKAIVEALELDAPARFILSRLIAPGAEDLSIIDEAEAIIAESMRDKQ